MGNCPPDKDSALRQFASAAANKLARSGRARDRALGRALRVGAFCGALGLWFALTARSAHAGGFEIPDTGARAAGRGGAMVVGAEDLTALHYNPGLLARQRGTTFLYNQNLIFHRTTFARAPLQASTWGVDQSFDSVSDRRKLFAAGLFAVVASDFGLKNWTFAAGIYSPNSVGKHDFPAYGPQSFQLTDMNVLLAYYNLAAAWKFREKFGIGLTFQWVDMIAMDYGLVVDATVVPTAASLDPIPREVGSTQLNTRLHMKDHTAATGTIGLWYRPHPRVELGAASRFVPVYLHPKGGLSVDKDTIATDDIRVDMRLTLPATFRAGVRYIHETTRGPEGKPRRWFDLELDAFYENWRAIGDFSLDFEGSINGQALQPLSIPKKWRDTVSLRLGTDIYPLPPYLTLRAGGFYETSTQDLAYSHIDFPAFARGGIGAGLSAGARGVYFTLGYMHVFQQTRSVSEAQAKVFQQRPLRPCPDQCGGLSGVPANAGKLRSSFDLLNLGLEFRFSELIKKRRNKGEQSTSTQAAAGT